MPTIRTQRPRTALGAHAGRSTKDPGQQAFAYQAGVGAVITGWDQAAPRTPPPCAPLSMFTLACERAQGLLGAKVGEERELIIPAHEGYGAKGFPAWGIPPGGTLNFTLEVLSCED